MVRVPGAADNMDSSCEDVRMDENGREDFVSVEPLNGSVRLLSEQPGGATAMVVIPRDQAAEVSRQILRSVWDSSSHAKRLRIIALLLLMVVAVLIGSHLAGEALPV
jgi:hypothetical protein